MRAMVLDAVPGSLALRELPVPTPARGQVLLAVDTCGICRTDLHVVDGELTEPALPLVPGHQVVGRVIARGDGAQRYALGTRVGIAWLGGTCGHCRYCLEGRENLCGQARFTGYTLPGGYAEHVCADERFCFALPAAYDDASAAPLLCAGLIGYRALVMVGDAPRLGIYGIGAAAHIVMQLAKHEGRQLYAFTRSGDVASQAFARSLGAVWAGGCDELPPDELDAAILFAPVGELVPLALRATARGSRVICAGIHMSPIPSFDYALLWGERSLSSVANLTRKDGEEFFARIASVHVATSITAFPLEAANEALDALRRGRFQGAGVLLCSPGATFPTRTPHA